MEQKIYEGYSLEEATQRALSDLKVKREEIQIDVIKVGKRGFLGIGRRPFLIKAILLKDILNTMQLSIPDISAEVKRVSEMIRQTLIDLLQASGIEANVDLTIEDHILFYEISDNQYNGLIIGKNGHTLNSLQALCQTIFFHNCSSKYYVVIDIAGYRNLRKERLLSWTKQAVEFVRDNDKMYRFTPMIPFERNIIIQVLLNYKDISFRVRGSYPDKYLEITKRVDN